MTGCGGCDRVEWVTGARRVGMIGGHILSLYLLGAGEGVPVEIPDL